MHLPIPFIRPQTATEPPAMVRVVGREDVQWDRPVFRAPPLKVQLPKVDATIFGTDLRRDDLTGR